MIPNDFFLILILSICFTNCQGVRVGSLGPAEYDSENWKGSIPPPYSPIKLEDVKFQLFTRNPQSGGNLDLKDDSTFLKSSFNVSNPTKIVVHGWNGGNNEPYLQGFKNTLLQNGQYNFIEVGWEACARRDYLASLNCIHTVANFTGQLVKKLSQLKNVSFKDIHLIGHSLGAQLVGLISKYVGSRTIGRTTGLDPASPKFENTDPSNRLDPSDAEIVDAIYTGLDNFGSKTVVGSINFYPNANLQFQPGCTHIDTQEDYCNHHSSVLYFIDTVPKNNRKKYVASQCDSVENLRKGDCNGEKAVMGLDLYQTTPGLYFIQINKIPDLGF